jgi:hypothetical protein
LGVTPKIMNLVTPKAAVELELKSDLSPSLLVCKPAAKYYYQIDWPQS